jgi:hypothetical protein
MTEFHIVSDKRSKKVSGTLLDFVVIIHFCLRHIILLRLFKLYPANLKIVPYNFWEIAP